MPPQSFVKLPRRKTLSVLRRLPFTTTDADRRRGADCHRLALVCWVLEIVTAVARPSSPRSG
jgi:hypothetical protein